jgi:hypothetical protein
MQEIKLTTEQAEQLQAFVTAHRNACYMHLYDEEDVREGWEPYDAYDGCDICDTREQLMATFDWLKSNGLVDVYVE